MKTIIIPFFVILITASFSCTSGNVSVAGDNGMSISKPSELPIQKAANSKCVFEKKIYDLGEIQQGEIVKYTMTFVNEGPDLLVIKSARASCGCTVPKWTREPVAAGAQGQLEVTFDSSGRSGKQHKSVMLITNSKDKVVEVGFIADVITD